MKNEDMGSEQSSKDQNGIKRKPAHNGKKTGVFKIVLMILAGLILLLSLSVVIYWGITGVSDFNEGVQSLTKLVTPKQNDVYYKKSYSVSDEKANKTTDRVVATVADTQLTNGLLRIFYWMDVYDYLESDSYYAIYSGLDYSVPLDEQSCMENNGTWQQFFLEQAINKWHHYQALTLLAEEEGFELSASLQEDLDSLRENMAQTALDEGISGLDSLIQADLGAGCTYRDYEDYMRIYYTGYSYLTEKMDAIKITQEDLQTYYDAHHEELAVDGISKDSGNVVDVRHILVAVEGGTENEDGDIVYSEQEWETCRQEAQKILDEWLAGHATEDRFALLAGQYSADEGSNANGGLYTSVNENSGFVPEFIEWCMDDDRRIGDYGLLQTEYGYHVMYFSGSEAQWVRTCRDRLLNEKGTQLLDDITARYPMDIQYKKIALNVNEINFAE